MNKRIFVSKIGRFDTKSDKLLIELKEVLNLKTLTSLKIFNIYDLFNIDENIFKKTKNLIFSYENIDEIQNDNLDYKQYIAYELLPLQFDNRANSVLELLQLYNENDLDIKVRTGIYISFNEELSENEYKKIKNFLINPIEQREKNLKTLSFDFNLFNKKTNKILNFISFTDNELKEFINKNNYALSFNQLKNIQKYFKNEKRNPLHSELMMFDIYWSDHCRHTTFNTIIKKIYFKLENNKLNNEIKKTYNHFFNNHKKITNKKNFTLLDLSLLTRKNLEKNNKLNDLEKSKEINAISIEVKINNEINYLIFKNETHNHPSELEPFSGASTCLGGAMRDVFAARGYCFAGMRLSGCGNILENNNDTLNGKLSQYKIATETAKGFSSYGNQVGLSTQYIEEFYDDSYKAKHLECGAVLGVVPKKWVQKSDPKIGDLVFLVGAGTGIDGIGGASGSSKIQNDSSLKESYNEVQKGNPIIARKLQRLYRSNPNFIKLIKRSNDFGAGGAAVAIGEISNGVEIYLENFQTKYLNISPQEILFSESQERMAMVIDPVNKDKFLKYINNENLYAFIVAKITNNNRIKAFYEENQIIDISRSFLNDGAYIESTDIEVIKDNINIFNNKFNYLNEKNQLKNKIKKGLIEIFDSSIGSNSLINPMGGKFLLTQSDCLISKIPSLTSNESDQNVIVTSGFNTDIASNSPYHMGFYSLIEAISKMVSKQINYNNAKVSLQEYFPNLNSKSKWSLPFTALLGVYKVLDHFNLPVVGGKDSMSGTYNNIDVIPTVISFLINTFNDKKNIITNILQKESGYIYLLHNKLDKNKLINLKKYQKNINWFLEQKNILSSEAISNKTLETTLLHMAFGNKVNFIIDNLDIEKLKTIPIGDIVFQTKQKLLPQNKNLFLIGKTYDNNSDDITINGVNYSLNKVINDFTKDYEKIYPYNSYMHTNIEYTNKFNNKKLNKIKHQPLNQNKCNILHPIFPGTNCEYDTIKKFSSVDSKKVVNDIFVFKNKTTDEMNESINIFAQKIHNSDIIMLNGGFSLSDEPDGSAKYIACILQHEKIKEAIIKHLANKKLILGICNGFQALINSGILPNLNYKISTKSPILKANLINKHISTVVLTKYLNINSPWISDESLDKTFRMPISHGEGCFSINLNSLDKLISNQQIAALYCDENSQVIYNNEINPNNSQLNIEAIISNDGLVLGKMGHSERINDNLYQNINGIINDPIFENGVKYILGINYQKQKKK